MQQCVTVWSKHLSFVFLETTNSEDEDGDVCLSKLNVKWIVENEIVKIFQMKYGDKMNEPRHEIHKLNKTEQTQMSQ